MRTFNQIESNDTPSLIVQRFVARANRSSAHIYSGESDSHLLPHDRLWVLAQQCRHQLRKLGLKRGSVLALACPSGAPLLATMLAAWADGMAVALLPADVALRSGRVGPAKFAAMLDLLSPDLLIAEGAVLSELSAESLPSHVTVAALTAALETCRPADEPPHATPDDIAILQFTSGSSGTPKAVVITHAMLAHNCAAIACHIAASEEDRMVSWLPPHHDMGLSAITQAWWNGMDLVLIPTAAYVRRPLIWLDALSRFGGTLSPAPASAYLLMTRFAPSLARCRPDLSRWRYAWAGAEPVFDAHLRAFTAAMAPYGLRADVVQPAYGMAEAVVAVSLNPPAVPYKVCHLDRLALEQRGQVVELLPQCPDAVAYASNGHPVNGVDVRVVDDSGRQLPERRAGHLQIRGKSVIHHYWGQTCAWTDDDGWYATGDIGFLVDGEVYISGRAKDLITRAGLNISPHYIEWCIEQALGLRPGSAAAFAVLDAGQARERVIAAVAHRAGDESIALRAQIAQAVVAETGIQLDEILFVRHADLPKTTSGKLQRAELRRVYAQTGTLCSPAPILIPEKSHV